MTGEVKSVEGHQTRAEAARVYPWILIAVVSATALASVGTYDERALFVDAGLNDPPAEAFVAVSQPVARALRFLPRFGYGTARLFSHAPWTYRPAARLVPASVDEAREPSSDSLIRMQSPLADAVLGPTSDSLISALSARSPELAEVSNAIDPGPLLQPTAPANSAPVVAAAAPVPEVPEPATWLSMIAGFWVVSVGLRRRNSASVEVHAITTYREGTQAA